MWFKTVYSIDKRIYVLFVIALCFILMCRLCLKNTKNELSNFQQSQTFQFTVYFANLLTQHFKRFKECTLNISRLEPDNYEYNNSAKQVSCFVVYSLFSFNQHYRCTYPGCFKIEVHTQVDLILRYIPRLI